MKQLSKADKPKLFIPIVKQFKLSLMKIAERSNIGHVKYADIDQDWEGFTRFPIEYYQDALMRHLFQEGESHETEIDHLTALAWNALVLLERKLRHENSNL